MWVSKKQFDKEILSLRERIWKLEKAQTISLYSYPMDWTNRRDWPIQDVVQYLARNLQWQSGTGSYIEEKREKQCLKPSELSGDQSWVAGS